MTRIDVARGNQLQSGVSTQGILREIAFETDGLTVSRSRVARGVSSQWHHHGDRHLYGFLDSGQLRLEYGPRGHLVADVRPGDFFHIPPRLVHRDVNPSPAEDVIVVNVLVGGGPTVINVDGPEPE